MGTTTMTRTSRVLRCIDETENSVPGRSHSCGEEERGEWEIAGVGYIGSYFRVFLDGRYSFILT